MDTPTSSTSTDAPKRTKPPRALVRRIAEETIKAIEHGSYTIPGPDSHVSHDLTAKINASKAGTTYYAADSQVLSSWSDLTAQPALDAHIQIEILEISTIEGARLLSDTLSSEGLNDERIGILNFASAKSPGGGFLGGSRAQEESLARSSTLYPSLTSAPAAPFYTSHKRGPKGGFYSHAGPGKRRDGSPVTSV